MSWVLISVSIYIEREKSTLSTLFFTYINYFQNDLEWYFSLAPILLSEHDSGAFQNFASSGALLWCFGKKAYFGCMDTRVLRQYQWTQKLLQQQHQIRLPMHAKYKHANSFSLKNFSLAVLKDFSSKPLARGIPYVEMYRTIPSWVNKNIVSSLCDVMSLIISSFFPTRPSKNERWITVRNREWGLGFLRFIKNLCF